MGRQVVGALYAIAMVAVIVGVDVAFFRNRFWERLMVNVGIVLVFAAFYLRFFSVHEAEGALAMGCADVYLPRMFKSFDFCIPTRVAVSDGDELAPRGRKVPCA
jgi:hypothetical protein